MLDLTHNSSQVPSHTNTHTHTSEPVHFIWHAHLYLHIPGSLLISGVCVCACVFVHVWVCVWTHGFVPLRVNKAYRYSRQLAVLIQAQGQMLQCPAWLAVSIYLHLSICLPLPSSSLSGCSCLSVSTVWPYVHLAICPCPRLSRIILTHLILPLNYWSFLYVGFSFIKGMTSMREIHPLIPLHYQISSIFDFQCFPEDFVIYFGVYTLLLQQWFTLV